MRLARILLLSLISVVCGVGIIAQNTAQVEVTKNVNLHSGPSRSDKILETLRPPERLDVIEDQPTNGYFHIKTEEEETGWVYSRYVKLLPEGHAENLTATIVASSAAETEISGQWPKGTPNEKVFHGKEGDCAADGNGFDPDQYILKNRTDVPDAYHTVTWSAIDDLDYPKDAPTHRKDWSPEQLAKIKDVEGIPVRVVGYLVAIKPQNGSSGEGTNCKFNQVGDVDTHLAIVAKEGDGEADSVVVEFTPRFLKKHPNWTKQKLSPWLDSDQPVRVSGWLMLDPDHKNHLGKYRDTLWEIHPITDFEVFKKGKFVDLDAL